MDEVMSGPVMAPFWVGFWPIINLIILILVIVGFVLFIKFIVVKLKKIDKLEQSTEEILNILKSKDSIKHLIPPIESLPQNPRYPKNESGETYGSGMGHTPYERRPDLIESIGVDGTVGYVRQSEIDGEPPKSPEEALARQAEQTTPRYVNLYKSDGKTIIGKFKIG